MCNAGGLRFALAAFGGDPAVYRKVWAALSSPPEVQDDIKQL
jgi:hypothetical protein